MEVAKSFKGLKHQLCKAPILVFPSEQKKLILDTDASYSAICAVLSKIRGN